MIASVLLAKGEKILWGAYGVLVTISPIQPVNNVQTGTGNAEKHV